MRLVAIAILSVIGVIPAWAAELPSRKPGLWEIKMEFENRSTPGQTMRQCIDASTDQMMQSNTGPYAQSDCKRDVQKSANGFTIDSTCAGDGKTWTVHSTVTGNFDSAYTMTATIQRDSLPGGRMNMTVAAKWLGPCRTDQKPGDMIMGNGIKMNILEMQKGGPSQGPPLPR